MENESEELSEMIGASITQGEVEKKWGERRQASLTPLLLDPSKGSREHIIDTTHLPMREERGLEL